MSMIQDPFPILRPFDDLLQVGMFTKEDDVRSDEEAAQLLGGKEVAALHQVHGNRVIVVTAPSARVEKADGMITQRKNLTLCIRWADCQNFVIFCPKPLTVGLLHVGWRGIEAKAITEFFRVLRNECGVDAQHVYVGAGPSLCQRCADFSDPAKELPSVPPKLINGNHVDLRDAATREFIACGVPSDRIDRHPDCTRCSPELYWTYRGGHREEVKAGHTNMLACRLL